MAWCLPANLWPDPFTGQISYGMGAPYTGNVGGQLAAGQSIAAWISLANDQDRLNPYLWSLVDGPDGPCVCVSTSNPQDAPLPSQIKWDIEGDVLETVNTPFAEIEKVDGPNTKKADLDACFLTLYGCTFSEYFQLCLNDADFPEVVHPTPVVERCDPNHLQHYAGFQGQVFPITSTNFQDQVLGWLPTSTFTADCDGVVDVDFSQPWARTGVRDCFVQVYVSARLLKNGVPIATRNNLTLFEHEHREEVGEVNNVDWRQHSFSIEFCADAAAGDEFVVEHRYATRKTRDTGPQTYARLLIYREAAVFTNTPTDIVVGVAHA